MKHTWLLVADASRGRLFESDVLYRKLVELQSFLHAESRLGESDVFTDGQGRSLAPGGGHGGNMEPRTDHRDNEARRFAQDLVEHLDQGRREGRFEALVLVAPPSFLGVLRGALPKSLATTLQAEIAKDYTQVPAHELGGRLLKQLEGKPFVP